MDITVTSMETCDLVVVTGRIDSYTAPNLSEALNNIAKDERYKLVLELGGVSYVSSAGLRVLIDIQKTCKKKDEGEVLLVNTPQRVYETLELAGFVPLFRFFANVESAVAAF
jgi:anti-sigma B factor antagonist